MISQLSALQGPPACPALALLRPVIRRGSGGGHWDPGRQPNHRDETFSFREVRTISDLCTGLDLD